MEKSSGGAGEAGRDEAREARKVAAVAAALAYLQVEAGAAREAGGLPGGLAEERPRSFAAAAPPPAGSPWALYARQRIMSMRSLLQRRALKR